MRSEALQRWIDKKIAFGRWAGAGILATSITIAATLINTQSEDWYAHQAMRFLIAGSPLVAMHLIICFDRPRYRPGFLSQVSMAFGHLLCLIGLDLAVWSYDPAAGAIGIAIVVGCILMLEDAEKQAKVRPVGVPVPKTTLARLRRRLFASEFKLRPARTERSSRNHIVQRAAAGHVSGEAVPSADKTNDSMRPNQRP